MEHLRRSRAPATGLGRRRPLTVAAGAGPLIRLIAERLGDSVRDLWTDEDTVEYQIDGALNVEVLQALRDDPDLAFFLLGDAAAVDYGPGVRFEVVYHLFSWKHPVWLRIRAHVSRDDPRIRTITGLWEGAMFHEREMYDMMGIVFEGNRDLRRIFMSPDYKSFPQRRDFLLPDDAADSAAAGVNPLERPETWDLSRFAPAIVGPVTATPTDRRPDDVTPSATAATMAGQQQAGETDADKSRPR